MSQVSVVFNTISRLTGIMDGYNSCTVLNFEKRKERPLLIYVILYRATIHKMLIKKFCQRTVKNMCYFIKIGKIRGEPPLLLIILFENRIERNR